jgi:hypothetical protein
MRAMRLTSFAAALTVTFFFLLTGCSGPASNSASSPGAEGTSSISPSAVLNRSVGTSKASIGIASVEFSSSQYSVSQAAGSVSLTVERTGLATSAASVVYGTVAGTGTAIAGSDYTFAKGVLSWAENDSTPRTISVPVSDATPFSGSKSFRVQLWAPSDGLAVATPGSAMVSITGNASDSAGTLRLGDDSYQVSQASGALTASVSRTGGVTGDVRVLSLAARRLQSRCRMPREVQH